MGAVPKRISPEVQLPWPDDRVAVIADLDLREELGVGQLREEPALGDNLAERDYRLPSLQ
jgi:hypothetical protein